MESNNSSDEENDANYEQSSLNARFGNWLNRFGQTCHQLRSGGVTTQFELYTRSAVAVSPSSHVEGELREEVPVTGAMAEENSDEETYVLEINPPSTDSFGGAYATSSFTVESKSLITGSSPRANTSFSPGFEINQARERLENNEACTILKPTVGEKSYPSGVFPIRRSSSEPLFSDAENLDDQSLSMCTSLTDADPSLSSVSCQDNSFASSLESHLPEAENGKRVPNLSSGYVTQASRQSELSFATSFESEDSVFVPPETSDVQVICGVEDMTTTMSPTSSRFSSVETVVNAAASAADSIDGGFNLQKGLLNTLEGDAGSMSHSEQSTLEDDAETTSYREQFALNVAESRCHSKQVGIDCNSTVAGCSSSECCRVGDDDHAALLRDHDLLLSTFSHKFQELKECLYTRQPLSVCLVQQPTDAQDEMNFWENHQEYNTEVRQPDDTNEKYVRLLQMAAECGNRQCTMSDCILHQDLLRDIGAGFRNSTLLQSSFQRRFLGFVVQHAMFCSEILCTVPYCFAFSCCDKEHPEEKLAQLASYYRSFDFGIAKLIEPTEFETEFIKISPTISWPSVDEGDSLVPRNGIDFYAICPSGELGEISFYAQSPTILPKLLLIEMHFAIDGAHVWNRLRGLKHRNVVEHLWTYVTCSRAVVCSELMTRGVKSLKEVLSDFKNGISATAVRQYVAGMLSAVEFLNSNHIFYLLWTAESIGLMSDYKTIRLRDFSCAVDEQRIVEDEELIDIVCSCLPPVLIPPEMFQNDLGRHSEIWGIGCLMVHLLTGKMVLHHLLHKNRDNIRIQVQKMRPSAWLASCGNIHFQRLLSQVFVEKSRRLDVGQFRQLLQEIE